MRDFFKRNIFLIVIFILSFVCFLLSGISSIFYTLFLVLIAYAMFILANRYKKRYKRIIEEQDDNVFDGRRFDYDEDVYILQTENKTKRLLNKSSKFEAFFPVVFFIFIGICASIMAIISIVNLFL